MGFTTTTINVSEDSYVDGANPNTNYGTSTTLLVNDDTFTGNQRYALFKFDLSALSDPYFITDLKFNFYAITVSQVQSIKWDVVTDSWAEGTITYNNSPFFRPTTNGKDMVVGWNQIDIPISSVDTFTVLIGWDTNSANATLNSRESANVPYIDITYYTPDGDEYEVIQDSYTDASDPSSPKGSESSVSLSSDKVAFFRFDSIPGIENLNIDSIKLIYSNLSDTQSTVSDRTLNIHTIGSTWSEALLVFNNAPTISFKKTYTIAQPSTLRTYIVQDITSADLEGQSFNATGLAISGNILGLDFRESGFPAYIDVITSAKPIDAPTLTNPIEDQYIDRGEDFTATWTTDQPQAEYELEYSPNAISWTTLSGTTAQSRTISGGTFAVGDLYFRIRYKPVGSSDWSEWSDSVLTNSVNNPAAPTAITSGAVTTATPTITATGTGVLQFTITIKDSFSNVFETATVVSTSISYTVVKPLTDGTTYDIDITYKDITGFDSDVGSSSITTAFIKPNTPTVVSSLGSHYIELQITNPAGGTAVAYNDVYKLTDNGFQRVATNIAENGIYVDSFAESGKEQIYFIRAYASSGGYAQSVDVRETLSFFDAFMITVDTSLGVELILAPERREAIVNESTTFNFAGRKSSVVLYSGLVNENLDTFQYEVHDAKILQTLRDMVKYKQTVCYRDARGRKLFLALTGINVKDELPDYATVSFNSVGVDYNEVV